MSKRNAVEKDELQLELAQFLRQVIEDRRWSRATFARQIGVSPDLLAHWLASDYSPGAKMLSQILENGVLKPDEQMKLLDIGLRRLGFEEGVVDRLLSPMLPSASPASHDAELYIKLSKPEDGFPEVLRRYLLRMSFSKRFRTRVDKMAQIILWRFEEQSVQSVKEGKRPIFTWSIVNLPEEHKQYWPKSIPFLEVTGLWIDGHDIKGLLTPRIGEKGEHVVECGLGDGNEGLRDVRVDVRTFSSHLKDGRCAHEVYLPEAGRVRFCFDASSAGFNKAWIEGTRFVDEPRPFVGGPEGEGTAEVVIERPERGQYITIVAVARKKSNEPT